MLRNLRLLTLFFTLLLTSQTALADASSRNAMGFTIWANGIRNNGWGSPPTPRIARTPVEYESRADQFFNSLPPALGGDQYPPCFEGWQQQSPYCIQRNKEQREWRERDEEMRRLGIGIPIQGADAGEFLATPDEYKTDGIPEEGRVEGPTQLSDSGDLGDQA